jgi:hypothetical protein
MIAYPMASWLETRAAKFAQAGHTCLHAAQRQGAGGE